MAQKVKHEAREVLISELKEFEGNPNIHQKNQINALAKSINRYGQYYPIIVDENMTILAGHGKKEGLKAAGKKKAKVTVITGLTEKQKKKLVLEDNKIQSMSHMDFSGVEAMLRDIGEMDVIGFPEEYLDALLSEATTDNMGVDYTKNPEAVDPTDEGGAQQQKISLLQDGAEGVNTIKCPHCSKVIHL